ncbi:zinc finger protein 362 isoform X3 [Alligator mississippiensis]|uniref:zinc finger protein 362 isoform X3 n=1 Tax=Alligator mississippiensis TaxID=8496 RepID=UPI000907415E|nr:zinc finger protein 362 isoform X3 [Alligator mississippiensis]
MLHAETHLACSVCTLLDLEMDRYEGKQRQFGQRMAEPRFNNPYFWPPPPTMPSQGPVATSTGGQWGSLGQWRQHSTQCWLTVWGRSPEPHTRASGQASGQAVGMSDMSEAASSPQQAQRSPPEQLDNLVLINKIKEQLMAEKIRPPHLPPTSVSSQQPLLVPPSPAESSQSIMSLPKLQQVPGLHPQAVPQPDVALHARPATSTVTGLGLASRAPAVSTSETSTGTGTGTSTPSTPTSTSQSRLIASSPTLISGITSPPLLDSIKTIQGHSLLGAPKSERGRKKIKAENPSGPPVLVVPYPILASGETAKEGKTYRLGHKRCKVCPLTFFTKSEMQIHSKSHTEAKPHKCPHCSKSFANASYLAQHLRIHLGVKPYHCSYCEKSFRQLSHLQQHTRIHTGDRPYKCPHPGCEKAFTQLSNLQSHQRQHNKDKPYKCPNCYRAYTDSASLQIHLSAHAIKHAKAYCCSMCGRAYTSETYLMKHMSKHTVVEHLVSQHSPQRTESPGIPVRISLI